MSEPEAPVSMREDPRIKRGIEGTKLSVAVGWWKLAFSQIEGTGRSGSIRAVASDPSCVVFVGDINSLSIQSD